MPKKRKKLTKVDAKRQMLEREFEEMHNYYYRGEPTRQFDIGQRVQYGRWKWSAVLDKYENGRFYKLVSVTPEVKYGQVVDSKLKIHYETWFSLQHYRHPAELKAMRSLIKNDDLQLNFMNTGIIGLLSRATSFHAGVDFNPDYQRDLVWTLDQKIELIDSIFNNVDIGKFAFIRRPYSSKKELYEIIDGKQRLTAILDFYEDRFMYQGHFFSDLCPRDQSHFEEYNVSVADMNNVTEEQKLRYFLMLNKSGTPIEKRHIERVEKMLKEAAEKVDNN